MSSEAAKPAGLTRVTAAVAAHPAAATAAIAILTIALIAAIAYNRGWLSWGQKKTSPGATNGPSGSQPADMSAEAKRLIASINGG